MDAGTVSFQTTREFCGVWRWKIERQSSNRLVKLWAEIGSSSLDDAAKVSLVNVAWALASFQRSYDVFGRGHCSSRNGAQRTRAGRDEGTHRPTPDSLDYLIGMSLWMDLGDVLVAYRTIMDRFGHLRTTARGKESCIA